ncbi:Chaperone protein HscB [hydrothermal vent metagenome]|uniref:Chaperone protein HscB n=1 Tax=hydrothermal vent metagenome TaxID=652676 RepID=A0A3B0YJW0_9ZZZZ
MSSVLTQNFFELFSLPLRYAFDRAALDARYRDMQRSVHPDRFASASGQERRIAMQHATHINEAYQTLKSPLRRARYLLELRGRVIDDQQTTQADPAFLMQQIELREQLGDIRGKDDPLAVLDGLAREIGTLYKALESELAEILDADDGDIEQAVALIQKMQFFTRLQNEAQELEADLEDELL